MLVPFACLQKQRDEFFHGCLDVFGGAHLGVAEPQDKVSHHPNHRLHDGLYSLLHVVHQFDGNDPQVFEDEGNIRPHLSSEESLRRMHGSLPGCDTRAPERVDEVRRDERPFLWKLRGQVLWRLHREVSCCERNDCLTKRSVRVEEVRIELWAQHLRAEVVLQLVGQARHLQVQSFTEHLTCPRGAHRLVQQPDEERRVPQLTSQEHHIL
mmetsp:Transcript_53100/g.172640  ORF Transcript_53100/g.172640 Transcript_53100/m.172640 type:complete len:210 (+) Transcript_53100:1966-2595(+)